MLNLELHYFDSGFGGDWFKVTEIIELPKQPIHGEMSPISLTIWIGEDRILLFIKITGL